MTGFVIWTIWKCVLTYAAGTLQKYSWYTNSLQNVIIWTREEKGLIALKLQYLFSFFPSPVTARIPTTAMATFSLSSICTLWRVTHFSNSILSTSSSHFHPFPLFSTKWTGKEKVPPCFSDVLQQGKRRPPRWSVQVCDGARVTTWISAIHDYARVTWAIYLLLLT